MPKTFLKSYREPRGRIIPPRFVPGVMPGDFEKN
jgi:hypothetical protein